MARRHHLQLLGGSVLSLAAFLLVPWLPRVCVVALARVLGAAAFRFSGRPRAVALANLEAVYGGTRDEAERTRIARRSFQTMALLVLDTFWFSVDCQRRLRRYVEFDERIHSFFTAAKPRILVAAHFGNWETLGQGCAQEFGPVVSVAAPLKNPFVDRLLRRMRGVTGQRVVSREGALRHLVRALRDRQTIALLIDQNVVPADGGLFVEFMGLPVPVSRSVAALYLKERPRLAFIHARLAEGGSYDVALAQLPEPECGDASAREVTQAVMRMMEQAIDTHPGDWLWMYKRWKFIPPGRSCEGYPDYARPIEPPEMKGR